MAEQESTLTDNSSKYREFVQMLGKAPECVLVNGIRIPVQDFCTNGLTDSARERLGMDWDQITICTDLPQLEIDIVDSNTSMLIYYLSSVPDLQKQVNSLLCLRINVDADSEDGRSDVYTYELGQYIQHPEYTTELRGSLSCADAMQLGSILFSNFSEVQTSRVVGLVLTNIHSVKQE